MGRLLLALLALGLTASTATATPRAPRLTAVHSFALALGSGDLDGDVVARFAPYDLIVVDGEGVSASQVTSLQAAGKLVIGYLDVGTIERGRPWFAAAKPYRLDFWPDFGEWYAATSRAGYRNLIADRVAPGMLAKGLDGLFLDNTDMIETHRRQTRGMRALVARLATLVHGQGRLLFAQNGEDSIGPILPLLDGWNREDVSFTYDFARRRYRAQPPADLAAAQAALRRIAAAGLLVTATDYTADGDAAAAAQALANACAAGALSFVSNIGLTRIPAQAPVCPPAT